MTFLRSKSNEEADSSFAIKIRNLSGVPVLDVIGEINRNTSRIIEQTASRLIQAGHYHLVLNIHRSASFNAKALRCLDGLVREVKKHYGGVTLVGSMEQAGQRISSDVRRLFRFCSSEADALLRIKGIPGSADSAHPAGAETTGTTARLAD